MSEFFVRLLERAAKTFVGTFAVTFAAGVEVLDEVSIDAGWSLILAAAGAAVSAVMSLLSKGVGPADSPSLVE